MAVCGRTAIFFWGTFLKKQNPQAFMLGGLSLLIEGGSLSISDFNPFPAKYRA